jgi:hypothetical protein
MTEAHLQQLREIASFLDGAWEVTGFGEPTWHTAFLTRTDYPNKFDNVPPRIHRFGLTAELAPDNSWKFDMRYPRDGFRAMRREPGATGYYGISPIYATTKKKAETIAKDIKRRILDEAMAAYDQTLAAVIEHESFNTDRLALLDELCDKLDVPETPRWKWHGAKERSNERIFSHLSAGGFGAHSAVHFTVHGPDSVKFEIESVPAEVARKIADFIVNERTQKPYPHARP